MNKCDKNDNLECKVYLSQIFNKRLIIMREVRINLEFEN